MQADRSRPLASPSPPYGYQSANHPLSLRSPLFAAPEQFVEPAAPFAFDVYSLGLCFLRLAWPALQEEAALRRFREELRDADGDLQACGHPGSTPAPLLPALTFVLPPPDRLQAWLQLQLSATALPPQLAPGVAAFPASDPLALALLRAMLNPVPAKRPAVEACLAEAADAEELSPQLVRSFPSSVQQVQNARYKRLSCAATKNHARAGIMFLMID